MGWQQIALLGRVWAILAVVGTWAVSAVAQQATTPDPAPAESELVCWISVAQPVSTNGQDVQPSRRYLLWPGDRVRVSLYQRADLPTEFDIREDGYISFPQIGQLRAAGVDVLTLEQTIAKATESVFGRTIPASVEVIQRRPLYVVGQVNAPGVYPYRVGLTVLHGVALAGGYFRLAQGQSNSVETSRELARASQSMETLKRDLALLARLQAELAGVAKIVPPARLIEIESKERIASLLEAQQGLLERRKEAFQNTLAAFDAGIILVNEEIAALQEQSKRTTEQVALAQRELDTLRDLNQRGLTRRPDLFAVERAVANVQSAEGEISARIARSKKTIADAERDKILLTINQKLGIEQEIVTVTDRISATELAIDSAKRVLADIAGIATTKQPTLNPVLTYRIIRNDGVRHAVIDATESTQLCPGDLIEINAVQ